MPSWQSQIIRLYLNYLKATTNWDAPLEKLRQATDAGARLGSFPKAVQSQQHPLISPLYADYTNLPPMLIYVGSDEIMLSDSTRLAVKAKDAGVDVQIKIWPGMWHVFPFFAPFLPEASQAITEIGDFIKRKID